MQLLQIDKEGPRRRPLRGHPPQALSRAQMTDHHLNFSRDSTLLRRGYTEPIGARGNARQLSVGVINETRGWKHTARPLRKWSGLERRPH